MDSTTASELSRNLTQFASGTLSVSHSFSGTYFQAPIRSVTLRQTHRANNMLLINIEPQSVTPSERLWLQSIGTWWDKPIPALPFLDHWITRRIGTVMVYLEDPCIERLPSFVVIRPLIGTETIILTVPTPRPNPSPVTSATLIPVGEVDDGEHIDVPFEQAA